METQLTIHDKKKIEDSLAKPGENLKPRRVILPEAFNLALDEQ